MCLEESPYRQLYPASCAIKCQQLILKKCGIDVSERYLCDIAKKKGWYSDEKGVYMRDNGKILALYGVKYEHSQHNTLESLSQELKQGHIVMVNVNRAKLFSQERITTNEANHAMLVDEIEPSTGIVYLTDTGTGCHRQKHNILSFESAWDDSINYMLSTK